MVIGLVLPTAITWLYFSALATSPAIYQKSAFAIGKTIQFGLPLLAFYYLQSARTEASSPHYKSSSLFGLISGLSIAATIYLAWRFVLEPLGVMDGPKEQIQTKLQEVNLTSTSAFIVVGLLYSGVHSLLEEYYWRWFIFGSLQRLVSLPMAVGISSVGFMAHHVLVLARYFGWGSVWTYLLSGSVAIGGVIWSLGYHRYGSLLGPWISHAAVDAAIFYVGYQIAF